MVADTLSGLGHIIQTERSLLEVFQLICNRWLQPQIASLSTVTDSLAWAVDALSLPWEYLDPYAFPPIAILGEVVAKLRDYPCSIILIVPMCLNMPWLWDLVVMSDQISLCLPNMPNLLTQPFNQTLHRNLSNLDPHALLLEPQLSWSTGSPRQW